MRLVFFARAEEAIKLYTAFKLSGANVCMYMGGMPWSMHEREIAKFDSDENAIMVSTGAGTQPGGFVSKHEAAIFFLEDSFASKFWASKSVKSPSILLPSVDELVAAFEREAYGETEQTLRNVGPGQGGTLIEGESGARPIQLSETKALPAPTRKRRDGV